MPHLEIKPPDPWKGKTGRGPYGDVVAELDHAIGRLLDSLKETGIDQDTLVVFSSDNGPAKIYQKPSFPGGRVGPLSGQKGSYLEGGFRVPGIFRWPGTIPAGIESDAIASTIDLLPTCAKIIGEPLPERAIDGIDSSDFLLDPLKRNPPRDEFAYYKRGKLAAFRSGPWKIDPAQKTLFHLKDDPGERENLHSNRPELADRLTRLAREHERELLANARFTLNLAPNN